MNNSDLKRSLQIINEDATDVAKSVGTELGAPTAAGVTAGKIAKKVGSKLIPGVGTALSWKDAWDRWKAGDRSGAVIAALAGTAFMVPGPGAAVGTALDAANIGRDIKAGEYDGLGQAIKDKIAGTKQTENIMNDADRISLLKSKIDEIQQLDEKSKFLKKIFGKGDKTPPPGAPGGAPKVEPSMYPAPAVRPGTAVANPPSAVGRAKDPNVIDVDAKVVKPGMSAGQKAAVGAAATAAAGTAGYMAGGSSSPAPAAGSSANPPAAAKPAAAKSAAAKSAGSSTNPPAASGLSSQEQAELDSLAKELESEMGRVPELDALLLRHSKLKGGSSSTTK